MTGVSATSKPLRTTKLHSSKEFALCRLYVTELTCRGGVQHILYKDHADTEVFTVAVTSKFKKNGKDVRPHVVFNVREEPATVITSIALSEANTKVF